MKNVICKWISAALVLLMVSNGARSEFVIEAGVNFVREDYSDSATLMLQKRWRDKWILGVGYMTSHCVDNAEFNVDCEWDVSQQVMVGGERRLSWKRWAFAFGLYYVDTLSRISSAHWNARSSLEYEITQRISLKVSHLSNGGTGDTITDCNTDGWCDTGQFNLGINTLAVVWTF
ncbi:MAG: hypothetical protein R3192_04695 [Woeseiaceae bacterium]|nr:hypothetical protein [Woeseiaceae bacterium]